MNNDLDLVLEAINQYEQKPRTIFETPTFDVALIAIKLAREGWKPVDHDLLAAREIVGVEWKKRGWDWQAEEAQKGSYDNSIDVCCALAAYKKARS
jgi:hypothetical protein